MIPFAIDKPKPARPSTAERDGNCAIPSCMIIHGLEKLSEWVERADERRGGYEPADNLRREVRVTAGDHPRRGSKRSLAAHHDEPTEPRIALPSRRGVRIEDAENDTRQTGDEELRPHPRSDRETEGLQNEASRKQPWPDRRRMLETPYRAFIAIVVRVVRRRSAIQADVHHDEARHEACGDRCTRESRAPQHERRQQELKRQPQMHDEIMGVAHHVALTKAEVSGSSFGHWLSFAYTPRSVAIE